MSLSFLAASASLLTCASLATFAASPALNVSVFLNASSETALKFGSSVSTHPPGTVNFLGIHSPLEAEFDVGDVSGRVVAELDAGRECRGRAGRGFDGRIAARTAPDVVADRSRAEGATVALDSRDA